MRNILIVIDMQNDFVTGSLGSAEAAAVVPAVVDRVRAFDGEIMFTQDTHHPDYLTATQEGRNLPVEHCIKGTTGWELIPELIPYAQDRKVYEKPSFGSVALAEDLRDSNQIQPIDAITLIGVCTDICVISNATLLKAYLPETLIQMDSSCCAGVTKEKHQAALEVLASCQVRDCHSLR